MIRKIILTLFLISSLSFANGEEDVFLKDGKYYDVKTNKLFNGYIEYTEKDTNIKRMEEDYVEGVITQKTFYYKSGAIQSVVGYADGEPFLEENYYEDGTIYERIFHKDGKERKFIEEMDGKHITRVDGKMRKTKSKEGDIYVYQINEDDFTMKNWGYSSYAYQKRYYRTFLIEEKKSGLNTFERKWEHGLLVYDKSYERDLKSSRLKSKSVNFYEEDNTLREIIENEETDNRVETWYFLNGNKKYEMRRYRDKDNKLNEEKRYFDESGKMLSEEISIHYDTVKSDKENYKKYLEMTKEDKPYKINYPNGKLAYEKFFTGDNVKVERYYTKDGILIFDGEYFPKQYEIKVKKLAIHDLPEGNVVTESKFPRNIKRYSPDGKLIYIESFEDSDKFTKFQKTSYHKNGKIYIDEKKIITKNNLTVNDMTYEIKRYDEDGKLRYSLKTDDKLAEEKYYDENGKLHYEKVEKVERSIDSSTTSDIFYYKNGNKRKEIIYEYSGLSGKGDTLIRKYFLNGELEKEYKE